MPCSADLQERVTRVLADADEVARERFEAAFETLVSTARERERLEGDARDAEALRRSDLIKTAVLQAISHDFRTPLATMAAAVGGLESGDLQLSNEDRAALLETIRLELARITRLVTNLLDFSRLQAGAAQPHPELWSVDDLVGQALDEIGEHERVTVSVPADLPAVRVDAIQLQRVLVNLLDNALKFSGEGGVELRASASGDKVRIEVLDRGSRLRRRGADVAARAVHARRRGEWGGAGAGDRQRLCRGERRASSRSSPARVAARAPA